MPSCEGPPETLAVHTALHSAPASSPLPHPFQESRKHSGSYHLAGAALLLATQDFLLLQCMVWRDGQAGDKFWDNQPERLTTGLSHMPPRTPHPGRLLPLSPSTWKRFLISPGGLVWDVDSPTDLLGGWWGRLQWSCFAGIYVKLIPFINWRPLF